MPSRIFYTLRTRQRLDRERAQRGLNPMQRARQGHLQAIARDKWKDEGTLFYIMGEEVPKPADNNDEAALFRRMGWEMERYRQSGGRLNTD